MGFRISHLFIGLSDKVGFLRCLDLCLQKKMEIFKKIWSNFETDLRPLKFSLKNLRPLIFLSKTLRPHKNTPGGYSPLIMSTPLNLLFLQLWMVAHSSFFIFYQEFCVKDETAGKKNDFDIIWPDGQYCIFKYGLHCPLGLKEGNVFHLSRIINIDKFFDISRNQKVSKLNSFELRLPDIFSI